MKVQRNRTEHMNNISRANCALGVLSNWTFQLLFNQVKLIFHANLPHLQGREREEEEKIINGQFNCVVGSSVSASRFSAKILAGFSLDFSFVGDHLFCHFMSI